MLLRSTTSLLLLLLALLRRRHRRAFGLFLGFSRHARLLRFSRAQRLEILCTRCPVLSVSCHSSSSSSAKAYVRHAAPVFVEQEVLRVLGLRRNLDVQVEQALRRLERALDGLCARMSVNRPTHQHPLN